MEAYFKSLAAAWRAVELAPLRVAADGKYNAHTAVGEETLGLVREINGLFYPRLNDIQRQLLAIDPSCLG